MSQEWYYSVDGDRQGPVSGAELKKLAEAGTLKATDLVWKDGMPDWVAAKSIKGLFGSSSAGTTAPSASKSGEQAAARSAAAADADDDRPARARRRDEDEDDEDDRPRRRRDEDDEDDDRPARSRRRDDEDDEDEGRPVRRRDEEDEDDDRPRKTRRRVPEDTANKKMVAGLLGILLGGLGIHKFYLGLTGTAVIQLLVSIFTCGLAGAIGIIEGIIYLTKSDEDFHQPVRGRAEAVVLTRPAVWAAGRVAGDFIRTHSQPIRGDESWPTPEARQKKVVAGILGILLGGLGVHRFYLGDTMGGHHPYRDHRRHLRAGRIIGLIEGIIYLTKSDADFQKIYVEEKKGWF